MHYVSRKPRDYPCYLEMPWFLRRRKAFKGCSIVILFMSDMRRLVLSMMIYVVEKIHNYNFEYRLLNIYQYLTMEQSLRYDLTDTAVALENKVLCMFHGLDD